VNVKSILGGIVALIIYIVFAIIYFFILALVVRYGAEFAAFGDGHISADFLAIAAAILSAGTIIAGGGFDKIFEDV